MDSTQGRASQWWKYRASAVVKNTPIQEAQEMWVQSLHQETPPEEEMATHLSMLVWRIPWTEEPGGLQSIGSQSQTWLSVQGNPEWKDVEMDN